MEQWEQEIIAAVRTAAREEFAPRAAEYDREGKFVAENVARLQELGVPGMFMPVAFGGRAASSETWMHLMEEIAYVDGSTAVALNMHLLVAEFLAIFPPFPRRNAVLEDIAKNQALMCAAGSVPTGELDSRKAGYKCHEDGDDIVFNGRAGFASMSEGAKYTILGGTIDRGEGNDPDIVITLPDLATPGLKLLYNWDAMGLRGTASHDIVAEGARVPKSEALVIPTAMMRMVQQMQASMTAPATQQRARGALGICAIWLGLAQAAFDFTVDYVKQRHGYLAGAIVTNTVGMRADQAWAQFGIGEMDAWISSGRIILYDTVRSLDTAYASPQEFTRALTRCVYNLRRMSEEVAEGAMKVCGAHAYVRAKPLERIYRDMVGGNVMAWKTDELRLSLGLAALGQPISFVGPAGT